MKTPNQCLGNHARTYALAALFCALAAIQTARADTIFVTTTADTGPAAPAPGSLRAALMSASFGDTIDARGITGTIVLAPGEELLVGSVTILGPGPDALTVDAGHLSRVFNLFVGATVTLDGLRIVNGSAETLNDTSGGGIFGPNAKLTVRNCVLQGHSAAEVGGAIYVHGQSPGSATLTVVNSTISGNSADSGGGIYIDGSNSGSAALTVINSTFSNNSADLFGGGVYSDGGTSGNVAVEINGSTFSGNSALGGGGIYNDGGSGSANLDIANSTFSSNSAGHVGGGAIYNVGDDLGVEFSANATVANCTLSGNTADDLGGGIFNFEANLDIGNTILKGGSPGVNIFNSGGGVVTSHGFNLSSDDGAGHLTAPGDRIETDPMLGPLADNAGPTLTHLPLLGSPAIDQGSSDMLALFAITTDQRGLARSVDDPAVANAPFGDGTDIGAVEIAAGPPPPPPTPVADVAVDFLGADKASVKQGEVLTYTIAVRNFGPDAAPNVVVNNLMSSGTGFLNARATKGTFAAPPVNESGAVVWDLGDMANGAAEGAELIVSVLVKGKTTVTNLVVVNSDAGDPDAENNVASITTSVAAGGNNGGGGGKKK